MKSGRIEKLEQRTLFSTALVLTGTTDNNTFFVRENANGLNLDAWINSSTPGTGTPTQSTPMSQISTVSVAAGAADNVLTLDFSNGDPFPSSVSLPGGSGVDNALVIQGVNGTPVQANGSAVTVGSTVVNYNTLQSITIDAGSTDDVLTQTGQPAAPLVFKGSGADTLNIQSGTYTLAGDPADEAGNLTINDAGSLFFTAAAVGTGINARNLTALNINSGGTAVVDSPPTAADRAVLVLGSLSINSNGCLDLTGNDAIVHNGSLGTLSADIGKALGIGSGTFWKGLTGITSSLAANDTTHTSAIGVISNDADGQPVWGGASAQGLFDGQSTSLNDVLLKFTVFGDANLDGQVDGSDYALVDNGFTTGMTGWYNGDFNFDGTVDGSDYSLTDYTKATGGTSQLSNLTYQLVDGINVAEEQSQKTVAAIGTSGNYPQYVQTNGTWSYVPNYQWTVGIWAGELWDLYAETGNPYYKTQATAFTTPLSIDDTQTNDDGPRIYDSFYPLLQQNPSNAASIVQTMLTAAASKATSYNATVGAFEGWRSSTSGNPAANYNVLLDLIMDSQLMFWAAKNDPNTAQGQMYYNEAVSNAEIEAQYNVHSDGTSSQFAYFNSSNGAFVDNETYQGYSNTSTWSRGEAWAIYGFNQVYQDTGIGTFLTTSENAANWFIAHLPSDNIPYWDFNAPVTSTTYRDTSAAAIAASGLLQLSKTIATSDPVNSAKYRTAAGKILASLTSVAYLENPAAPGDGTILHGAVNVPTEITDNPIVYGDYYFLEAAQEYLAG